MYYRALFPFLVWGICILLSVATCKVDHNQVSISGIKQVQKVADPNQEEKFEGEPCEELLSREGFGKSTCREGLVCVKNILNEKAYCRVPCGERSQENDAEVIKHPERCPAGRTCQLLGVAAGKLIHDLGAYCLSPQLERDGVCAVPDEYESCTEGRVCAISAMGNRQDSQAITAMVCRERCPYGEPNADAACKVHGEVCYPDRYVQVHQRKADGTDTEHCKVAECKASPASCPCDAQRGFACSLQGVCLKAAGLCVEEVGGMTAAKLQEDVKKHICNEVTGHRFCDKAAYQKETESSARGQCLTMFADGSGFCVDKCVPLDLMPLVFGDTTGRTLSEKQLKYRAFMEARHTCGQGYQCTDAFARAFQATGARAPVVALKGKDGKGMSCDLSICPDMTSCSDACGHAKAICVQQEEKSSTGHCAIYEHSCEPL